MADFSGPYTATVHNDYTEITVEGSLQIFVDDGETFENYLIDQTRSNASCEILTYRNRNDPHGDWAIRNVGFKGTHAGEGGWFMAVGVADGAEGLIENVYIGEGQSSFPDDGNPSWHKGGISYLAGGHEGDLTARNVYFQGGVDNGFYWSNGQRGSTITIEDCYAGPSHISCYRVRRDVTIRNSYADARIRTGRGIWAWDSSANVDVYDSHLHGGSGGDYGGSGAAVVCASGSEVNCHDTQYSNKTGSGTINEYGNSGNNPRRFVPEGCPESAMEAATGEGRKSEEERHADDTFVRVEGPGAFRVEVDGSVTPAESISRWATDEQFGDDWAGFELGDAYTEFWAGGEITAIDLEDGMVLEIDGEEVDPEEYLGDEDDEGDEGDSDLEDRVAELEAEVEALEAENEELTEDLEATKELYDSGVATIEEIRQIAAEALED